MLILTLLPLLISSTNAATPATVAAAKAKVESHGIAAPPRVVDTPQNGDGGSSSPEKTVMTFWMDTVSCEVWPASLVHVSYAKSVDGAVHSVTVSTEVVSPEGKRRMVHMSDISWGGVELDGAIETFHSEGADLTDKMNVGQQMFDMGIACYTESK